MVAFYDNSVELSYQRQQGTSPIKRKMKHNLLMVYKIMQFYLKSQALKAGLFRPYKKSIIF